MSAQLSFPPDRPIITRSPSSIRRCSVIALVTFLAILVSSSDVCSSDLGFVTPEAFASGKPVVTCRDSGGPAELVESGVNGLVCEPTADAVARALGSLMSDVSLAERMGAAALVSAGHSSWAQAVKALTG